MIKYCRDQWDKNKEKLRAYLKEYNDLNKCEYIDLVEAIVDNVLNVDSSYEWDSSLIHEIDDGDYQGTLIFLIPKETYQPDESEYLVTFVNYGSCSVCDTLLEIQSYGRYEEKSVEEQIEDFMVLCLHMIQKMKLLYSPLSWGNEELFEETKEN